MEGNYKDMKDIFGRAALVLGEATMQNLANKKVILFGVGGVGSWCAEGLIRSGIVHLTIVDFDRVAVSNINRQLMATTLTVGQVKVEALKDRLLTINPNANITTLRKLFSANTVEDFNLGSYDYIIDAVDSLKDKAELILSACKVKGKLFSSMGAALKIDPTKIKVAEFWDVRGCPLGAALRKKIKRLGRLPSKKFLCVYGDQVLANIGGNRVIADQNVDVVDVQAEDGLSIQKAVTNGSLCHITAIFGFTIAGLVIEDVFTNSI